MSLTTDDLQQINTIVTTAITSAVTDAVSGLATKSELKEAVAGLATKSELDQMESRLTTAMGFLQRDCFSRLNEHEARIVRLEKAAG